MTSAFKTPNPEAIKKPKVARNEKGQLLLGHAPIVGCGRPRGSRVKLSEAFIADCYENWLQHGAATIEKVRTTRPAQYLQVMASILPKDVNVNVSAVESMTDDELTATIKRLSADPNIAEITEH